MNTYMTPTQISTNVITPGVEVSVVVAYPNGESWAGTLRNTTVRKRHERKHIGDGRIWCPACNKPVDQCPQQRHDPLPASGWRGANPRRGRVPPRGAHPLPVPLGQLWCPTCETPVEECVEADEIRRLAALEGRVDE